MPIPLMAPVVGTMVGVLARLVAVDVLKMVALRMIGVALIGGLLPVVLNNFFVGMLTQYMAWAASKVPGVSGYQAGVVSFTAMGAWLAVKLQLPGSMAVVMSACSLRWTLNLIPFVRF